MTSSGKEKKWNSVLFFIITSPAFRMSQVIEINVLSEINHYS